MGSKYTNGSGYHAPAADGVWANNIEDRASFIKDLEAYRIDVYETKGGPLPLNAVMHDVAAEIPDIVVTPLTDLHVIQTLQTIKKYDLYSKNIPISVKSGGHGYFNGATCNGIMINLAKMDRRYVKDNILHAGPGCAGAQTVDTLSKNKKALPHGDCFGVGAGGHFITAGWCIILARKYGLGCQNVVGGRVVLWDGEEVLVNDNSHPELLHAMRGGAAAGVGIVTEVHLKLIDEPDFVTWKWTYLSLPQIKTCVEQNAFRKAQDLPREITMAFRYFFKPFQLEPICSFNIQSLLTPEETIAAVKTTLGPDVAAMIDDLSAWNRGTLVDLRMQPASELVNNNRSMLADMSITALHSTPDIYWEQGSLLREMARSYFTSISHWVVPESETMLLDLYEAFDAVKGTPARDRMYALLIQGGGRMNELQDITAMPIGKALSRFELHWDTLEEEKWSRDFTDVIEGIFEKKKDPKCNRPYRGDVWKVEQAQDVKLDKVFEKYNRKGWTPVGKPE
ncbi:FAD-binding oxidoreductase [Rhypophila decipiens]